MSTTSIYGIFVHYRVTIILVTTIITESRHTDIPKYWNLKIPVFLNIDNYQSYTASPKYRYSGSNTKYMICLCKICVSHFRHYPSAFMQCLRVLMMTSTGTDPLQDINNYNSRVIVFLYLKNYSTYIILCVKRAH